MTSATACLPRTVFCLLIASGVAAAQSPIERPQRLEVDVWAGLAQNSPRWGILGETPGLNFAQVAIRLARPLSAEADVADDRLTMLHVDIVPFALVSPPYISVRGSTLPGCLVGSLCLVRATDEAGLFPNGSSAAVGLNPLGLTTQFRRSAFLSPSVGATGGFLLFDRRVPTTRSATFNFTAAVELGLRLGHPHRPAAALSYRFHHISNAGMARENPGIASHLFGVAVQGPRRSSPR